jgi:hypothetical protein
VKKTTRGMVQAERRLARRIWGPLSRSSAGVLTRLVEAHGLSIGLGELAYIDGGWYVTHTGLVGLARRKKCSGIQLEAVPGLCDPGSAVSS